MIAVLRDAGLRAGSCRDRHRRRGGAGGASGLDRAVQDSGGRRLMRRAILFAAVLAGALAAVPADPCTSAAAASAAPPDLPAVQMLAPAAGPEIPFAEDKRRAAVRLAALGFGSRAGLARRSWEIAGLLDRHAARLTAIYRFGDLMLREGGFELLPPVVAETRRAFRLERAGATTKLQVILFNKFLKILLPQNSKL